MDLPWPQQNLGDPQERLLRSIPAFAGLPPEARRALAAHLSEQSFPKFARVLDEGEPADRLFLIEEGEVEVSIQTPEGRTPVSRLSQGEMFGEVGLFLASRRRTARVTAMEPVLTLTLRYRHLAEVLEQHPSAREVMGHAADHALVRSFVKRTRPFERLSPERLHHFEDMLKPLEFEAGTTIFKQGDPGDACYLVRSGIVEVTREEPTGPRSVARLEAGDMVGESALLTSTPRAASLIVVERAGLLALLRNDLLELLDGDKRVAGHVVELIRSRDRPRAKAGILVQPRPTSAGETIWVLCDPSRFGAYHQLSSLGLFVWNRMRGTHSASEVAREHEAERGPATSEEIARIMVELVEAGFAFARELDADAALAAGPPLPWWKKLLRRKS